MSIIKTGAVIYLPEWRCWHRCDVHEVGNCYVFVCGPQIFSGPPAEQEGTHAEVIVGQKGMRRADPWVYIIPKDQVKQLRPWH